MKTFLIVLGVLGGVFVIGFIGCTMFVASAIHHASDEMARPVASPTTSTADEPVVSEEDKKRHKENVQALINDGIFQKVDPNHYGAVVVAGSKFYNLDADDKKRACAVVLVYVRDTTPNATLISIHDALNDKKIGQWSPLGLKME